MEDWELARERFLRLPVDERFDRLIAAIKEGWLLVGCEEMEGLANEGQEPQDDIFANTDNAELSGSAEI